MAGAELIRQRYKRGESKMGRKRCNAARDRSVSAGAFLLQRSRVLPDEQKRSVWSALSAPPWCRNYFTKVGKDFTGRTDAAALQGAVRHDFSTKTKELVVNRAA